MRERDFAIFIFIMGMILTIWSLHKLTFDELKAIHQSETIWDYDFVMF